MITISTDKQLLDREFIHAFLTESYWAKGRTFDEMNTIIENSLNFGLYENGKQKAYARVLTDTVQFAYLMDVFVDPAERGKGYSKALMQFILDHDSLKDVNMRLATLDAHGLYRQFGFTELKSPENLMERIKKTYSR